MRHVDSYSHVRGESRFVNDHALPDGCLFVAVLPSPVAHGRITRLDASAALKIDGVRAVFTSSDITGENQIGNIIRDQPLLADRRVNYVGEPVAVVLAADSLTARNALSAIELEFDEDSPVFDPRVACANGQLIAPSRVVSSGDVDKAWDLCDCIVAGRVDSGGQEHLYLETQGAVAVPTEHGGVKVTASAQNPAGMQGIIARVLGLNMHDVEIDVLRLGGAFGGKENGAVPWATLASLAAHRLKKPVKLVLTRNEDMTLTGKRHPYSSDFKLGLTRDGSILACEITFYQNAGAYADLSTCVLERTILHATGSYFIPNVRATGFCCRTNLPPFTSFRGYGVPQATFVIESAIHKAAREMNISPRQIREKNLLIDGDRFHYGMTSQQARAKQCWDEACARYDIDAIEENARRFNSENSLSKRGVSVVPICFGISYSRSFLNQSSALVHIYTDGSVSVSSAAVEMGQGVNSKIRRMVSRLLSIKEDRIKLEITNTTRVTNTSPTLASAGAELCGNAARLACLDILTRLKSYVAREFKVEAEEVEIINEAVYVSRVRTKWLWSDLILSAYKDRINLSAQAHYATPEMHQGKEIEREKPFFRHVFGTAITEVTLDCIRGSYSVDSVHIVHNCSRDIISPEIDRGQVEGALLQGIGWMTLEELAYGRDGRLLSDSMSTYKIPDIHFSPDQVDVYFLETDDDFNGVLNSKAVGEPPILYGVGAYFALLDAVKAFRPDCEASFDSPLTPEKALGLLYGNRAGRPLVSDRQEALQR